MLAICIILAAALVILAVLFVKNSGSSALVESNRKASEKELADMRANYERQLAESRENYERQIADRCAGYERRIDELKESSQKQISELKEASEKQLSELKESFGKQNTELKESHSRHINELKESYNQRIEEERKATADRFKALASEILQANSQQLDERSRTSVEAVLAPVKERLEQFTKGFRECYDIENRDRLTLREEIKSLHELNMRVGSETAKLTNALKGNTRIQGQWGEMVLTNILEHSGLQEGRWLVTQESTTDAEGMRYRPDAIIHCPKDRDIIIDSKASLSSYLSMLEAEDEDQRSQLIDAHVKSVENHVATLRKKEYQDKIGAKKGDFVLMFMPHEGAYLAAMHAKPDLWQKAYDSHVIIVSPTHLVTVVRLVEQMWQVEDQTVNSEKIADEATRLLESMSSFLNDMTGIADNLERAQKSYDSAYKRLMTGNNNVVRVAKRLESLGVKAKKGLPEAFESE